MIARAAVMAAMILSAGLWGARGAGGEAAVDRPSLALLPRHLGEWSAVLDAPLEAEALGVLGVADYVNRTYADAAGRPLNLYIGYYASQRQGDAVHSPQNCLPGSGWQPVESARTRLNLGTGTIPVNRYLIERGGRRQIAYYWYEGRGRVVANEYANKLWLMVDAARLHRTNGSLVRVMTPVGSDASIAAADAAAIDFVRQLFPHLGSYLP